MRKFIKNLPKKTKKLRIAQVAPLWFTIPPKGYGGIERIVSMLTEELTRRGHAVTLFAAPGSRTSAKLISVFDKPLSEANIPWSNPIWNLRNLSTAFEMADKGAFDIIHSHLDLWALFFQNLTKVPSIHTMHNPLYRTNADATKNERLRLFTEEASRTNIVFISKSARKLAMVNLPKSRVIYNGIDLKHFRFNKKGGEHFIWIARMNKHKGVENAIAACEQINARLLLAGRIDPTQREYFEKMIKPHLNEKIRYVGELKDNKLSEFYGRAKALLYPIEWEEPFGLVVAEAMACGTPVIAYKRGSMEELIKDGESGFVVESDIGKLIEAMKKVDTVDRVAVRKHTKDNFSKERMVDEYEKLYYELCLKQR
ncbi:MAG: glycosyltransferase family 4 protein [Candidatus Sungbacteria bacterium]|nr:glycosyltransferase family 4 protein [Candidatus Sungbacteria bacterium]